MLKIGKKLFTDIQFLLGSGSLKKFKESAAFSEFFRRVGSCSKSLVARREEGRGSGGGREKGDEGGEREEGRKGKGTQHSVRYCTIAMKGGERRVKAYKNKSLMLSI